MKPIFTVEYGCESIPWEHPDVNTDVFGWKPSDPDYKDALSFYEQNKHRNLKYWFAVLRRPDKKQMMLYSPSYFVDARYSGQFEYEVLLSEVQKQMVQYFYPDNSLNETPLCSKAG